MSAPLDQHPSTAVGYISTAELARVLGKLDANGNPRPRAGRDWCKRHKIPLRHDGKFNFAELEAVRRAIASLPAANDGDPRSQRMAQLLSRTTRSR